MVEFGVGFDEVWSDEGGVWLVEEVGGVVEDDGFLVPGWCGKACEFVVGMGGKVCSQSVVGSVEFQVG